MEQIGFIGAYDKKDLLLNIAKVLTNFGKSVLIVDATSMQRFRYIVPMVSNGPAPAYISEYQGIDVAVGFINLNGVAQYLGQNLNYEYVMIDSDMIQTVTSFMLPNIEKNFFVTSYDEYELQRGVEIFKYLRQQIELYKVILSANINSKEEEYLNHLVPETIVKWKKEKFQFADTTDDRQATLDNQLTKEIVLKKYTGTYKDSLEYLISVMVGKTIGQADIRKMIRKM